MVWGFSLAFRFCGDYLPVVAKDDDVRNPPLRAPKWAKLPTAAMKKEDIYYQAMRARDPRFDGKFFVGVKTTGVYCRPVCPAKPKRENVEFFAHPWAAERAGYRPCLRCRPESAPHSPAWIGKSALVRRALRRLDQPESPYANEDRFAASFGVSARHLRRIFIEEVGKTPKQLASEVRLNLARTLIVETALPITQVAFTAGFSSVRRFNEAFRERFRKRPSDIRRLRLPVGAPLRITLAYRPPYDFAGLLHFYRTHPVGRLEEFGEQSFRRIVAWGRQVGCVRVSDEVAHSRLAVEIEFPDVTRIPAILARVRAMFDVDSDPVLIANQLEGDASLRRLLAKYPGIRLPSGWDPYETALGTILGQLVSVERGRALLADLVEALGPDSGRRTQDGQAIRLFPEPAVVAAANLDFLKSTGARKATIREFSRRVASGELSLEPTQDVEEFIGRVREIRGIGEWTAHSLALKVLRHADAFPATDLILARAAELHTPAVLESTRPWRGYVAALFWREYSQSLKKTRKGKSKCRSNNGK